MKLRLLQATLKSLCWYPGADGNTFVIHLRAPLTLKLAEALQCRGLCYQEPEGNSQKPAKDQAHPVPRRWEGQIGVPVSIDGGDISLGDRSFPFDLAHKFKIGRDEKAADTDITLYMETRIHFDGKEVLLYKFCQDTGKDLFSCVVTPAQGAFKFMDQDEAEDDGAEESEPSSGSLASATLMKKSGAVN